jgi:hypothetical protein
MPSWLLQVEISAFLQTGGVDLVAARKAELPRNDQRRPAFGESLHYHAVMRITNVCFTGHDGKPCEKGRAAQERPATTSDDQLSVSLYNIML